MRRPVSEGEGEESWNQGGEDREEVCAGLCGKREEFGFYFDGNREPWNTPFNTQTLSGCLFPSPPMAFHFYPSGLISSVNLLKEASPRYPR